MKKSKISFGAILSLVLLMAIPNVAKAAEDTPIVTFNANTELFTYENTDTYVADDGTEYPDLFIAFKDAIPGDSFTQEIEVKTKNIKDETVKIYLHSENPNEDYQEIMEYVDFTVTYEGEIISEGNLADGIMLGTFTSDETMDITVEFSIPIEVGNEVSKLYGTIDWVFVAELIVDETTTPKTGDESTPFVWLTIAVIAGASILISRKYLKQLL